MGRRCRKRLCINSRNHQTQLTDQFIKIGFLKKAYGVTGQLYMSIESNFDTEFTLIEYVYVDINGDYVPFYFENRIGEKGDYLIKFDDIFNPEDAKKLAGHSIYLRKEMLSEELNTTLDDPLNNLQEFSGYFISAEGYPDDMKITRIEQYPGQLMAIVESNNIEKLIPLATEIILSIDQETKIILMDLPEGL